MGFIGGRGTSRRSIKELKKTPISGQKYKEYQKKQKDALGDAYVSVGRGTRKIKISDIQETKIASAKGRYVSMGRGTGRRKVK